MRILFFSMMIFAILSFAEGQESSNKQQPSVSSPFDQSKFVPDISMIVDFSWISRDLGNDLFSGLQMPGLTGTAGSSEEGIPNFKKGFNFNYCEMSFYSIVDPYFDLFAVLHLSPEHAGLEEAYAETRKLPYGFQIKAGKFLSGFGRLNEQHTHYLDFAERPLVLNAFFGDEGLNEIGARLTWVAPTDFYLMLGMEVLTGQNSSSFGTAGFSEVNGTVDVRSVEDPGLYVGYFRSSFDAGDAAILFGLSYAHGKTRTDDNFSAPDGEGTAVDAAADILGGNLTVKYSMDAIRYIAFQSEYLYRLTEGSFYSRDAALNVEKSSLKKKQAGFYSQLVTKLSLRWRAGLRYDLMNLNNVQVGITGSNYPKDPARYSAMVEYDPTEFSRLRLQMNHDRSKYLLSSGTWSYEPFTEIILQLNLAIGAHGAHSF
jgi:hypothetical protein